MQARNIQSKPNYGIDAPGLVRFFFIGGAVALAIVFVTLFSSVLEPIPKIAVSTLLGIAATYLLGMGCFMLYGSRVMKLKDREKLLDLVQWSGNELVLDVGCGRGLMLVGAAKRLASGRAIGIDLWQQHDQADNSAAAAISNAAIEGVATRVEVETADMRQLPFPDNHFDVVVSSWAVHNLEAEADREKALDEMIRVLKCNGTIVLADIIHQVEYARYFQHHGMTDVRLHNNPSRDFVLKAISFGSFAPSAVSARKIR